MIKSLNYTTRELHRYRLQTDRKQPLSEKLTDKASEIWMDNDYYEPKTLGLKVAHGLHDVLAGAKFFTFGIGAITAKAVEMKKTKNKLTEILGCDPNELAIDINELISKKDATRYYGEELTYNAQVKKEWLRNIKMIWGHAHLEALDSMECLGSLESIWGHAYFSRCTDLSGLSIKLVYGDIHGEKLESINGLENLMYVGGTIYYQDKEFYNLAEFYDQMNIKKR